MQGATSQDLYILYILSLGFSIKSHQVVAIHGHPFRRAGFCLLVCAIYSETTVHSLKQW